MLKAACWIACSLVLLVPISTSFAQDAEEDFAAEAVADDSATVEDSSFVGDGESAEPDFSTELIRDLVSGIPLLFVLTAAGCYALILIMNRSAISGAFLGCAALLEIFIFGAVSVTRNYIWYASPESIGESGESYEFAMELAAALLRAIAWVMVLLSISTRRSSTANETDAGHKPG